MIGFACLSLVQFQAMAFRPLPSLLPILLSIGIDLWARGASAPHLNGLYWPLPVTGNWLQSFNPPKAATDIVCSPAAYQDYLTRYWRDIGMGLARYTEYALPPASMRQAVWQAGQARLYLYGQPGPCAVLLIPSLVNSANIFDLVPNHSFARWLAAQGVAVYLLDWGVPAVLEQQFGLDGYLSQILLPALQWLTHTNGKPPALLGYCMGGLLALAAAQLRPDMIKGLSLWATPWDFHASGYPALPPDLWANWLDQAKPYGRFPAEWLNLLFFWRDPIGALEKWRHLSQLTDSSMIERFIATENWAQQGVSLSLPVAQDCFLGWFGQNQPQKLGWKILGQTVNPASFTGLTMLVHAQSDRIVPLASSLPLAQMLPQAWTLSPPLGHVGLMASSRATKQVWEPLALWLKQLF